MKKIVINKKRKDEECGKEPDLDDDFLSDFWIRVGEGFAVLILVLLALVCWLMVGGGGE